MNSRELVIEAGHNRGSVWQFFANALSECNTSLLNNTNLISKVYFPRLIVPVSAVIVSFVD